MVKDRRKKWRKRILLILFVLLNVGIIAWTAVSEFADSENAADLAAVQIRWWLLIPAALMIVVALVAEVYKYFILLYKTGSVPKGMSRRKTWKMAQRTVLLGRYYDNITPAAAGGQPFQIFYMHKNKVRDGYDVVVPVMGMITDQLGFLVIGVVAILVGSVTHVIWSPAIVALGWLGLLVLGFFPLVVLAATFLPKTTEEIVTAVIKALARVKIIKKRDETIKKVLTNVKQYTKGVRVILRERGLFLKTVLLGAVYYGAILMIPFFVLSAFGTEVGLFACFATTAAVSAAVYFVPTPGNAGAAEGAFFTVFSILPVSGYVFWAMLCWRFFVYYIWLILGLGTQARMYFEDKNLLNSWHKQMDKLDDTVEEEIQRQYKKEGK